MCKVRTATHYLFIGLALAALTAAPLSAAPREGGSGNSANAGLKRLLTQLNKEKDELAMAKLKLEESLAATQAEQEKLSAKLTRRETTIEAFSAANGRLAERLKQSLEQGRALQQQTRERDLTIEKLKSELAGRNQDISEAEQRIEGHLGNNRRLAEIANELLARYENKGIVEAFKEREPLTGLERVELENLVQEYRFEIEDRSAPEHRDLFTRREFKPES